MQPSIVWFNWVEIRDAWTNDQNEHLSSWIQSGKLYIDPHQSHSVNCCCWFWLTVRRAIIAVCLIIHGASEQSLEKEIMCLKKAPAVLFFYSSQCYSTECLIFCMYHFILWPGNCPEGTGITKQIQMKHRISHEPLWSWSPKQAPCSSFGKDQLRSLPHFSSCFSIALNCFYPQTAVLVTFKEKGESLSILTSLSMPCSTTVLYKRDQCCFVSIYSKVWSEFMWSSTFLMLNSACVG